MHAPLGRWLAINATSERPERRISGLVRGSVLAWAGRCDHHEAAVRAWPAGWCPRCGRRLTAQPDGDDSGFAGRGHGGLVIAAGGQVGGVVVSEVLRVRQRDRPSLKIRSWRGRS
jgi:hypothetical protein